MAKNTTPNPAPEKNIAPASFEEALRELETIVTAMENGNLDLDPSLAAYQRGMELLKFCQDKLTVAENKIRVFDQGALSNVDLPDVD
jgi:exodeoxyribonuclease VII small subunit